MAKSSAKTLKGRYDKFKKDCIATYWEFKHLSRKLKSLTKRAEKLADGIGKLTADGGESDPILIFRLGDFAALVDTALIDCTTLSIHRSSGQSPPRRNASLATQWKPRKRRESEMNTDKLWLIPVMAFTLVPICVFVLGLFLTLFAEFFDWLAELWEKKHKFRE